jgi:glutaredoxin
MDSKAAAAREKADREDTTVQQRLREAEAAAKKAAEAKGPKKNEVATPLEISVAGRKKKPAPPVEKELTEEEKEEKKVEDEMNSILKRGPSMFHHEAFRFPPFLAPKLLLIYTAVIIFSKSYCPHSARAKSILVDKYLIDPPPYVVELDQNDLGPQLQALLAKNTGRKTVPNVLINGKSIGGGDETKALDESGELPEKVKSMGGKRILQVELRNPENAKDQDKGLKKE